MKLRNKKKGGIIENACIGVFKHNSSGDCERVDTEARSIEKFLEEWEDYTTKEPKIIDENNRKLVRDWSKLYGTESIRIYKRGEYISLYKDEVPGYSLSVGIDLPKNAIRDVEDDHYYSTFELCGEEE